MKAITAIISGMVIFVLFGITAELRDRLILNDLQKQECRLSIQVLEMQLLEMEASE